MAVRAIARNAIEMTADGDLWLAIVRVDSIIAYAPGGGGNIDLYTNILDPVAMAQGLLEAAASTTGDLYWSSGALNANEVRESAISLGDASGLRLSAPSGGRVVIYIN